MARHYSPYPTITDLRRASFSGWGSGSCTWGSVLSASPVVTGTPQDAAKDLADLRLSLPKRPSGLSAKETLAWDTLENIDIISARLNRTYDNLVRILGRSGAAACDELQLYNQTALDCEAAQRSALLALRAARVPGLPDRAPFPRLFVGMGVNADPQGGRISCASGELVPAAVDSARGVRIMLRDDACPVGGGFQLAPLVIIGITLVVTVGGVLVIRKVADVWGDVAVERENTQRGRLMAEFLDRRIAKVQELMEKCIAAGGDGVSCLRTADSAAPKEIDALRKTERERARSLLWWVGAATVVAGATWGVIAYRRHRMERRAA